MCLKQEKQKVFWCDNVALLSVEGAVVVPAKVCDYHPPV